MKRLLMAVLLIAAVMGCVQPGATSQPISTPGSSGMPTLEPGGGTPNPSLEVPPPIY
jgi:hypothetical protein